MVRSTPQSTVRRDSSVKSSRTTGPALELAIELRAVESGEVSWSRRYPPRTAGVCVAFDDLREVQCPVRLSAVRVNTPNEKFGRLAHKSGRGG